MIDTARSLRGIVSAPHRLAAEAGLRVLREGGNAIEAMIAAAATITGSYTMAAKYWELMPAVPQQRVWM